MDRRGRFAVLTCLTLLNAVPMGCKSSSDNSPPSRGGAVDTGDLKLDVTASPLVEVVQPTVDIEHGTTTIAGSVRRKAGVQQAIGGRIDIDFVDTDGEILDSLPALLTPPKIPLDAASVCEFRTSYDYVPPKGSTVRLHFVDSDMAAREDLAGHVIETGHINGGNPGGGGNHSTAPSHYGNNGR